MKNKKPNSNSESLNNNRDEKNFINQQNEKSKTFYSKIKPNYESLNNKRLNYEITENKKENNNNNKEDNSNEKSKTFYSNIKPNSKSLNNKRLNYEITEKTETNNNNKCEIRTVYTNRKRNHRMISVKVSKTVKPN